MIVAKTSGLTVRQHEREGIELPIEFAVCSSHDGQVRFSPSSSSVSATVIRGLAVDISSGGLGLKCRQFVPRMCEGTLRVYVPMPGRAHPDGTPQLELMLEHRVKIRRVFQVGREQMYSLGVAFVDPDSTLDKQVGVLLDRISKAGFTASSGGGANA